MKLKTRLIIAFFTITLIPIVLSGAMIMLLGRYQMGAIEKTYGVTRSEERRVGKECGS